MLAITSKVFACDPKKLGVMRVDLTADVPGVPVDWFKRHTLVKSKQTRREIGSVESYQTITKGRAETLYAGVKPNQIRIYDKVAERRMQYARYCQGFARETAKTPFLFDVELTSFETMYGHRDDAVITRVERQVSGRDVEKLHITSVGTLRTAHMLDPFEKMLFFDAQRFDPRIEDWGFRDWCAGMHLQQRVQQFGVSETLTWMRAQLGKNFDRAKKNFAPFLRVTDNVIGIDAGRLKDIYRRSAIRQLTYKAA